MRAIITGVATDTYHNTATGIERTVLVNVLNTVLLALLTIPILHINARKHNISPTLTIVSSDVHAWTPFPERKYLSPSPTAEQPSLLSILSDPQKTIMSERYAVTKLLELFSVISMTQAPNDLSYSKSTKTSLTINACTPGFCHSNLARDFNSRTSPLFSIDTFKRGLATIVKALIARSTEQGARTLVHAGLSGRDTNGKFLADCRVTEMASLITGNVDGAELESRKGTGAREETGGMDIRGERLRELCWGEIKGWCEGVIPGVWERATGVST